MRPAALGSVAGSVANPGAGAGIEDLRAFLLGPWRLARAIQDRRSGRAGSLRGRAAFAPEAEGLCYRERGHLRLGAHAGPAHQVYLYRFPRPDLAAVHFADGRPFHDLDLSDGAWETDHLCGADTYHGRFQVLSPHAFAVRWRVAGPRKDYVTLSRYRRILGRPE